ncbi:threonine dehydratase [Pendulispora brunnea]|uniref:Threonine dehydratase n=1 Tax=Pendulispora brunnea TaxID=2905690 RepID=A0ABZ2K8P7_9BACT
MLPDLLSLRAASEIVYRTMKPTPQYRWPLLVEAVGAEVWVKHENHTPVGAFKVRGGLVYFRELAARQPRGGHVVSATRGNHGQSIGFSAGRYGIKATIFVPHGNSREKNAAMQALGVELIEHGEDFQAAREEAARYAEREGFHFMPSFHADLVRGVASYWFEFFEAVPNLDVIYVPIGLGSGICAAVAVREALGLRTRIVGVTSAHAPAYALSFKAGKCIEAPVSTQLADGMACRTPDADAVAIISKHVDEVITVSDAEIAAAMRLLFTATHNVAEGAGAAALAGALQQRASLKGRRAGLVVSGGNVDADVFASVLRDANV